MSSRFPRRFALLPAAVSLLAALSLVVLPACTPALTELVVVVDSDLAVPGALDEVLVTIEGTEAIPLEAKTSLAGAARLPVTLGVRPREPGSTPVRIRAIGRLAGIDRVEAQVRTRFVEGERRIVRLHLRERCAGVRCGDDQTCSDGACVDAFVEPGTLEPFDPARDPGAGDGGARDLGVDAGDPDAGDADAGVDAAVPCPAGYMRAGAACVNADECAAVTNPCGPGTCVDNAGSYACFCPSGYRAAATPTITCADVDECVEGMADCDDAPAAVCVNAPGDYACTCPPGYEGTGRGAAGCADVDECATNTDDCDDMPEACVNGVGDFACACPPGFAGDGRGAGGCVWDDPALSALSVGAGAALGPSFAGDTTEYALVLAPGATSATLTPRVAFPAGATIAVDGVVSASGTPVELAASPGFAPRAIVVVVTAESGVSRTYTITLVRSGVYLKASNTGSVDQFGCSLALSADGATLAVGACEEASSATGVGGVQSNDGAAGAGAVYVFRRTAGTWAQEAYVKASNTEPYDGFGAAVALSSDGSVLVVGASKEDASATGIGGAQAGNAAADAGAAYVFRRTMGVWAQEAYVKASNTGAGDEFGTAVAVSPDGVTFAVGAPREDSGAAGIGGSQTSESAMDAGAVYVFRRALGAWSQEAYVKASNTGAGDLFGSAVSLASGLVLAVGAPEEDSSAVGVGGDATSNATLGAGAVYVFRRVSSTWSQEAYVKASNTGLDDNFGRAVALSSDGIALAVGAPYEGSSSSGIGGDGASDATPYSGAVYVYRRTMSTWGFDAYVKASNVGRNDYFGSAVSLSMDGSTLLVGASNEFSLATGIGGDEASNAAPGAGAAYVFRRVASVWSQTAYVKASNTATTDFFGTVLAMSGDGETLVGAAPGEDSGATGIGGDATSAAEPDSGAVYAY